MKGMKIDFFLREDCKNLQKMQTKKKEYTLDPKELLSKPFDDQREDWYNNNFKQKENIKIDDKVFSSYQKFWLISQNKEELREFIVTDPTQEEIKRFEKVKLPTIKNVRKSNMGQDLFSTRRAS